MATARQPAVYLVKRRQNDESFYSEAWQTLIFEKYPTRPSVSYFEPPSSSFRNRS